MLFTGSEPIFGSLFLTNKSNTVYKKDSLKLRGEKMNTVEVVSELIEPLAKENGFRIVDIEYVKEGKNWFLRIYIDKPGGVDLNDCAKFNELVSEELDNVEPDPIPFAYYLEVSSPGAERPIKTEEDFELAVDHYIHVSLYHAVEKQNVYEGTLMELNDDDLTIKYKEKNNEKEITLSRDNISKARHAIEF